MKVCSICGKGSYISTTRRLLRGHYNPTTTNRKYPNLQWVVLPNSKQRVKACTNCIKTLHKGARQIGSRR